MCLLCLLRFPIECEICKIPQEKVWPLGNGLCDRCLADNFSLGEALIATDLCLHEELKRLYQKRAGEKKSQVPIVEYAGPHFGNALLPDDDW